MKCFIAESIPEYLDIIKKIRAENSDIWFRGQPNAAYTLCPSLIRYARPEIKNRLYRTESSIVHMPNNLSVLNYFKKNARSYIKSVPDNDLQWLFLMQHYGLPTKLMDWSEKELVALYFALGEGSNKGKESLWGERTDVDYKTEFLEDGYTDGGCAVFAINPVEFNGMTGNFVSEKMNRQIYNLPDFPDMMHAYVNSLGGAISYLPICIKAVFDDDRIKNQGSVFTFHGFDTRPLDHMGTLADLIYKIFIPFECHKEMYNELKKHGITHSYIYPGLDGLCRQLKEDILERFA